MKSNFLITVEDDMPVFSPIARTIKEFNRIIARDRGSEGDSQGRKKLMAMRELAFIAFYADLTSPYRRNDSGDDDEVIAEIKRAVELPDAWVKDLIVDEGIKVYREGTRTASSGLLVATRAALHANKKTIEFIQKRLTERMFRLENEELPDSERDALIDKVLADSTTIVNISDKISDSLEKLDKLEQKYIKELEMASGKKQQQVNSWQL